MGLTKYSIFMNYGIEVSEGSERSECIGYYFYVVTKEYGFDAPHMR